MIIPEQTAAAVSQKLYIGEGHTVSIKLTGLWGAGEAASVEYYAGPNFPLPYWSEGVKQELAITNQHILITGPFEFRINKGATSAVAGVEAISASGFNVIPPGESI